MSTLGVRVCADVYERRAMLAHLLTPSLFTGLLRASLGIGTSVTPPDTPRKSLGHERTFAGMSDRNELLAKVCCTPYFAALVVCPHCVIYCDMV